MKLSHSADVLLHIGSNDQQILLFQNADVNDPNALLMAPIVLAKAENSMTCVTHAS